MGYNIKNNIFISNVDLQTKVRSNGTNTRTCSQYLFIINEHLLETGDLIFEESLKSWHIRRC